MITKFMKHFITQVAPKKSQPRKFSANSLDRIILLRGFAAIAGVELSLPESKSLVEANEKLIENASDFVSFVESVINSKNKMKFSDFYLFKNKQISEVLEKGKLLSLEYLWKK